MKRTDRKMEYIEAIDKFIKEKGYSPTIRELGKMLYVSSPATVYDMLFKLREEGLVSFEDNKQRTIRVIKCTKQQ